MYFGFKDIKISYDKRNILDGVTLDFKKGKITTIIGKNGCGKSTLLRTIAGSVEYQEGEIILEDYKLKQYRRKDLARKIAYLPQYHESPSDITVETLVSYGRYPYMKFGGGFTIRDRKKIEDSIRIAGLSMLKDKPVSTLSGGERQRAFIAMCIAQEPEIFILDEPTTYLDISFQYEILDLIKRLNIEKNMTIIMVLHDLNLAARYSDYIYAIKDRHIFDHGDVHKMITADYLLKLFDIDADIIDKDGKPYFIVNKIEGKLN